MEGEREREREREKERDSRIESALNVLSSFVGHEVKLEKTIRKPGQGEKDVCVVVFHDGSQGILKMPRGLSKRKRKNNLI